MNKFEEKLEQLNKKKKAIEAEKVKILSRMKQQETGRESRRKFVTGALLLKGAEDDLSFRRILLRLIETANERDKSLFNELVEKYNTKKPDEVKPVKDDSVKSDVDSTKS